MAQDIQEWLAQQGQQKQPDITGTITPADQQPSSRDIGDFLKTQPGAQPQTQQQQLSVDEQVAAERKAEESRSNQQRPSDIPFVPNSMSEFMEGLKDTASPVRMLQGAATAIAHPGLTWDAIVDAQQASFDKAKEEWAKGNHGVALAHVVAGSTPLIGPQLENIAGLYQQSPGRANGQVVGLLLPSILGGAYKSGIGAARKVAGAGEAAEAAEAATQLPKIPIESEAETAARVQQMPNYTPENAIKLYQEERAKVGQLAGLNNINDAYAKLSPTMKPWLTQQLMMQALKDTAGDWATAGQRLADLGKAVPLDQKVYFNAAQKALDLELARQKAGSGAAWTGLIGHVVPGMRTANFVMDVRKIMLDAMANPEAHPILQRMAKLPMNSPELLRNWNLLKTAQVANVGRVVPGMAVPATAAELQDRNGVINLRRWGMAKGGAIERMRRNTLNSLY